MLPSAFDGLLSFNRDETRVRFEKELISNNTLPQEVFSKATRMMEEVLVEQMKDAILSKEHFVLETPLSHPDYWRYIDLFERNGYQIQLNYLCLDKVSDCIARVGTKGKGRGTLC